jgi:hypothetical protein
MTLNSRRIIELATKLRLPAMYQTRNLVEDGGLMTHFRFLILYRD